MFAWALFIAAAVAAPPTLPAGEDAAAWEAALDHAGVEAGVALTESTSAWTLTVRVGSRIRMVEVEPAQSADDWEEIALLAASLAREVRAPSLPDLPTLPTLPRVLDSDVVPPPLPIPVPTAAPSPTPEDVHSDEGTAEPGTPEEPTAGAPTHTELLPTLTGAAPAALLSPRSAPSPANRSSAPVRFRPSLSAGPALSMRGRVRTAASVQLWAGAAALWWQVGLGVEVAAPALLPVDHDSRMQTTDGVVGAWVTPAWLELGGVAALSTRGFTEAETSLERHTRPWVGAETAVRLPVGRGRVRVAARLARDLADTELIVGGVRLRVLDPWHGGLSLRFGFGPPLR